MKSAPYIAEYYRGEDSNYIVQSNMPEACPYMENCANIGILPLFLLTMDAGLFFKTGCNLVENIVNNSGTVDLEIFPFIMIIVA